MRTRRACCRGCTRGTPRPCTATLRRTTATTATPPGPCLVSSVLDRPPTLRVMHPRNSRYRFHAWQSGVQLTQADEHRTVNYVHLAVILVHVLV